MPSHDIIVVGTSRGGLHALQTLVRGLQPELPAAILVVQHIGKWDSTLPQLLSNVSPLPVVSAEDAMEIMDGRIYVAPSDHHMLVETHHIHIVRGPKENFSRPAINPLFRSAAAGNGAHVTSVVLTGTSSSE